MNLELNKVYCVDCLEGMKLLDDESVSLIIADYPFNSQDGRKDYDFFILKQLKSLIEFYNMGGI